MMRWDSFKKGGSRDWRVGLFLLAWLIAALWLNYKVLSGDFGPHAQRGALSFWGLK